MVSSIPLDFAGERFLLDTRRALYWRAKGTLVIADLHIGKAQDYVTRGTLLPPYEMQDICERLVNIIRDYEPARVICLGDSFHRASSFERLCDGEKACLQATMASVPQWVFVEGNHDTGLASANWRLEDKIHEERFTFLHQPDAKSLMPGGRTPQIVGHYHPKFKAATGTRKNLSKPCFAYDDNLLILPSFGTYTGGLNVTQDAISCLFAGAFHIATADTVPQPARFLINGGCQSKAG